jgi:hypothetical protein
LAYRLQNELMKSKLENRFSELSGNTPNFQIAINRNEDTPMIDCKVLERLVLEVYSSNPYTPVKEVATDVEKLAALHKIFPSSRDCQRCDIYYKYYGKNRLSPADKRNVARIIWNLIRENLLLIGEDRLN